MSVKIQGIPHASAYAWRIPVHYFTVIAKIHPKSPAAMDFALLNHFLTVSAKRCPAD